MFLYLLFQLLQVIKLYSHLKFWLFTSDRSKISPFHFSFALKYFMGESKMEMCHTFGIAKKPLYNCHIYLLHSSVLCLSSSAMAQSRKTFFGCFFWNISVNPFFFISFSAFSGIAGCLPAFLHQTQC